MKRYAIILGALACGAALPAHAQSGGTFAVSTGLDYSSGDYGSADTTNILVAPVTASYRTDRFRLSATLPYLRIDGAGVVLGPDGQPLPGVPTQGGSRSGLGDASFGATLSLPSESLGGLEVDVGGRVKLPTSKESKGLGTGKTDFSVSTDIAYPIGNWAPFVTLGYRILGDPDLYELDNSFTVSAGTSLSVGHAVLIASYEYAGASSPFAEDSRELFGAVNAPISHQVGVTGYGTVGLSKGAPDFGLGLLLTFKWR